MRHTRDTNELLEILGDELRPVVADDARMFAGELFAGPLKDGLDIDFLHFFADFEVDDESAEAVEDGAEEVESAGDVEVADVDVPFLMRLEWLNISGSFLGDVGGLAGEQPGLFEDAVNAGGAAGD